MSRLPNRPAREYRTFWDWFVLQRQRGDDLGELANFVYKDPARKGRAFTVLSLNIFIREHMAGLDSDFALAAQAEIEYARWRDIEGRLEDALYTFHRFMRSENVVKRSIFKAWRPVAAILEEKIARDGTRAEG